MVENLIVSNLDFSTTFFISRIIYKYLIQSFKP